MSKKCLVHKIIFLVPAFAAAASLARFIPLIAGSANMPQQNNGDPLAVLLGDVRMIVSNEMIGKADQYFHGGITEIENCSHGDGHFHSGYGPRVNNGHDGCDDDHIHDHEDHVEPFDPWASIKHAVRLPVIDQHLDDDKSRELLPWFWAAIRLDPQNTRAYLNAAYVLEAYHNMPEKALEIIDSGIQAVPHNPELEFSKGMLLFKNLNRTDDAIVSFRNALSDLSDENDDDSLIMKVRLYEVIGKIAQERGDSETLRDCFEKANAIRPDHSCTKNLMKLMNNLNQ